MAFPHQSSRWTVQFKETTAPDNIKHTCQFSYIVNRNVIFCFLDRPILWAGGEILCGKLDIDNYDKYFGGVHSDDLPPFLSRIHFLIPHYTDNLIEFLDAIASLDLGYESQ